MRVLVVMNHALTEAQERTLMGDIKFVRPGSIPSDQRRSAVVEALVEEVEKALDGVDAIVCQTDYELFTRVLGLARSRNIPFYISLTERVSKEERRGRKVVKMAVFEHRGWRRLWPEPAITVSTIP